MLTATGVTIRFGKRTLFEDVNIKFNKDAAMVLLEQMGQENQHF